MKYAKCSRKVPKWIIFCFNTAISFAVMDGPVAAKAIQAAAQELSRDVIALLLPIILLGLVVALMLQTISATRKYPMHGANPIYIKHIKKGHRLFIKYSHSHDALLFFLGTDGPVAVRKTQTAARAQSRDVIVHLVLIIPRGLVTARMPQITLVTSK